MPVRTTKQKATSDGNIRGSKSAGKLSEKAPKVRAYTLEGVELLLKYLMEYKAISDFNEKDLEHDLLAMYTKIRRCLAFDCCDFRA